MTVSPYQFDAEDADAVLVTNDAGMPREFHVHRCILAAASPFFHDMFSLPQPEDSDSKTKAMIPVTDSSQGLEAVLRMIYPVPDPVFDTLDDLAQVLGVAVKYDLTAATDTLRKHLISSHFINASPLRVYAIACRFDLDDEMRFASKHTLSASIVDAPLIEDLKYIDGYSYHRLLKLHQQRVAAAHQLLKIPSNVKCMQCNGSTYTLEDPPKWWLEFERKAREELALRPTTDVIFGLEFLFRAAGAARCSRCPESILDSWKFLRDLKAAIDALPCTV